MKKELGFRIGYDNEKGISLIALIVAIFLLGSIGFILSSLMSGSQESIPRVLDGARAFSLTQAGINFTGKYINGVEDWSTLSGTLTRTLGSGSFQVQWGTFSVGPPKELTVTIRGISNNAQRQIMTTFIKTGGSSTAIISKGGVSIKTGSWLDCKPSNPSNPLCTGGPCECTQSNVSSSDLPSVWFSSTPPALPIPCKISGTGNYTIPAGVYYCSSGILWDGAFTVSVSGPVTIFTNGIEIDHGANINGSGNAANLLVISKGEFRIHHPSLINGAVYSPGYNMRVDNQGMVSGILAGGTTASDTVKIETASYMNFDSNAGRLCPYFNQTGISGGSGGSSISQSNWQQ